jgi:hypothetical protein
MLDQKFQESLRSPYAYSSVEGIMISSTSASDLCASCALVNPLIEKARRRRAIDLRKRREPNMVGVDSVPRLVNKNCDEF